ncbi:hypothetical protein AAVH_05882 [Aphelenchoides avenae]|nr:hypothetical protein AAVH_05882 [Aphelenchus avenae]
MCLPMPISPSSTLKYLVGRGLQAFVGAYSIGVPNLSPFALLLKAFQALGLAPPDSQQPGAQGQGCGCAPPPAPPCGCGRRKREIAEALLAKENATLVPPVNATDATFALQTANATNATTAAPVNAKLPILNLSDMSADECPMTEWLDVINESISEDASASTASIQHALSANNDGQAFRVICSAAEEKPEFSLSNRRYCTASKRGTWCYVSAIV